ncbi:hypothetical protein JCM5353_008305 [Sporobolomyces roseus]
MVSFPRQRISPLLLSTTLLPVSIALFVFSTPYLPALPAIGSRSLTGLYSKSTASLQTSQAVSSHQDTVDIVISYYNEPLPEVNKHLKVFRDLEFVKERSERVVIYNKGPFSGKEIREALCLKGYDEVVPLENVGREGETYLKVNSHEVEPIQVHILLTLDCPFPRSIFSSTTTTRYPWYLPSRLPSIKPPRIFVNELSQPTLSSSSLISPGNRSLCPVSTKHQTGFAHFAPLIEGDCGKDLRVDLDFLLWSQLFAMFTGRLCEPGGQTMAWSAQFVVSRRRILANPYNSYLYLDALLSAPANHWIHDMWGPNDSGGPSNPAFGHTVERIWPAVFDCWDGRYARECTDDTL